jgi:hypothetical protein
MTTCSARVQMKLGKPGGSKFRLPDGTRSLLFKVDPGTPNELLAGAVTETKGKSLRPGAQLTAWLHFWASEVAGRLQPDTRLVVWYGQDVGEAWVREVKEDSGEPRAAG